MISRFDPIVEGCELKKTPFLNNPLTKENGVFNPLYVHPWEHVVTKFVNFQSLRPSTYMSVRDVVYSRRPNDNQYMISPEMLS